MDFITNLPLTKTGHDSILALIDSLSKMAHFAPAKRDLQPQILWMYSPTALFVAMGYLTHSSLTAIAISSLILGTICVIVLASNSLYRLPITPRATAILNE